ncbi:MAG: hypothetical protein J2P24_00240 [Streptosporangiales bacterium]|nr:hypothetical protein [Streptosporangiales bacterium]
MNVTDTHANMAVRDEVAADLLTQAADWDERADHHPVNSEQRADDRFHAELLRKAAAAINPRLVRDTEDES